MSVHVGVRGPGHISRVSLWGPGQIGSALKAWFDAADPSTITLNSGNISAWANKGSLGGTAAQGTAANQPAYTAAALNGLPVARFDGTNDGLSTGNVTLGATTLTALIVGTRSVTGSYDCMVGQVNGAASGWGMAFASTALQDWQINDLYCFGNGFNSAQAPRAIAQTPAAATNLAPHILRADLGTTSAVTIDGSAATLRASSTAAFTTVTAQPLNIGYTGSVDWLAGDIAEVLVGADLAAADVLRLEGYLAWKWGLQGNLPTSHPYKARRP